jgi:hypothetical protein
MNSVFDFDGLSLAAESGARGVQSPTGTLVGLFATTPLSALSGSTGVDRLVSAKLFMCQEVKSLYRGSISNSGDGRFCIRTRCDVKTHKANKITVKEGQLYIRGSRKDQALSEPSMDAVLGLPGDSDPRDLAHEARPLNVWRAFFTSEAKRRERLANGSEKSWEEVLEAPTLSKLSEVDTKYQTQKKLKVGTLLEGLVDTIPVGVGKAEAVEVIKDHMTMADGPDREYAMNSSIQTVLAEWNKVCAGIELFNAEFGKLGKG